MLVFLPVTKVMYKYLDEDIIHTINIPSATYLKKKTCESLITRHITDGKPIEVLKNTKGRVKVNIDLQEFNNQIKD